MSGLEVAGRRRRGGPERRRAEAADWLWPPQKKTAFQEVEDVMLKNARLPHCLVCGHSAGLQSTAVEPFSSPLLRAMGPRCIFLFALRLAVLSAEGRGPFTGLRQKVVMNSQ